MLKTFLLLGLCCLLPRSGQAQKQLTPSSKVVKVAFVDHSRLRKDYKVLSSARAGWAVEAAAQKKTFDQQLQTLDQQVKEQLRLDSLSGGGNWERIQGEAATRRSALSQSYQTAVKKLNDQRTALYAECEKKIAAAIDAVVGEGGYTEVKPLTKEAVAQRGADITDAILNKLN